MRWSCPHCGTQLAVPDEKLETTWSFSRCYKCNGFALVRRSEINLIKVDRAPSGEKVILPESSEETLLGKHAQENLARYSAETTQATQHTIRPAGRRAPNAPAQTAPGFPASLPEPLPEFSGKKSSRISFQFLPYAIGMAGALAITSGIYLYIQGQTLWTKAKSTHGGIRIAREVTDSVHQAAMAPIRSEVAPMAPVQVQPVKAAISMTVRPRTRDVQIHSGPGNEYSITGYATFETAYSVSDWSDRWFKVASPQPGNSTSFGWIRNDQVQIVHP